MGKFQWKEKSLFIVKIGFKIFCLLVAGSGNWKDRDFLILKNLISISSSSFSIRLIFDPQFFCFFFERIVIMK